MTFDKFVNLIKNNGNFICYDEDEYYAENIYINEQITSAKIRIELLDDRAMIRWYYKQNASKRVDILYCKFLEDEVLSDILIEALGFILRELIFYNAPLEYKECRLMTTSNNDMWNLWFREKSMK